MIVNYWPQWFRDLYGGAWPREYCAFDLETTGFDMKTDVITHMGHVLVADGAITNQLEIVFDWTDHPIVNQLWLRNRIAKLNDGMALSGRPCHTTYEGLAGGMRPEEALAFYVGFFDKLIAKGVPLVAHNGYGFDEPMFESNVTGFQVAPAFEFGDNNMLDTMCIEKASHPSAVSDPALHPKRGDTLRSYFKRVRHARVTGASVKLDEHCAAKYDFASKGFPREKMHGALADSTCVHFMMEAYRGMITDTPSAPRAVSARPVPPPQGGGQTRYRGQRNR